MAPAAGKVDSGAWVGVVLVLVAVIIGTIVAGLYASASSHPLAGQVNVALDAGVR